MLEPHEWLRVVNAALGAVVIVAMLASARVWWQAEPQWRAVSLSLGLFVVTTTVAQVNNLHNDPAPQTPFVTASMLLALLGIGYSWHLRWKVRRTLRRGGGGGRGR